MIPFVTCYSQPGKRKSEVICEAFARGAGGFVGSGTAKELGQGPAAFYGVVGIERLFEQARAEGRTYYYGDNAYFDRCRGMYFRFTKNALQPHQVGEPDWPRFQDLRRDPARWQRGGAHVVVVEQSEHFLNLSGAGADWLARTTADLKLATDRPLRVRPWRRDKDKAAATLLADLAGAWALVTHMSAAAVEAVVAGVPVFVTGQCAATPMASGHISQIERPKYPDGRRRWAAWLAGSQWTKDELSRGMAWRMLNG